MVRYDGASGPNGYQFTVHEGGSDYSVLNCTEPCEVMKTNGMSGQHAIPIPQGSVLWAMVEDARRGQLTFRPPAAADQHHGTDPNTATVEQVPAGVADSAEQAQMAIAARDLYAEYLTDVAAADAKYRGRRIQAKGTVIKTDFSSDGGPGNIRMVVVDVGRTGTTDSIVLCFTESCTSMRRPTVPDDQFKRIVVNDVVVATCMPEPVGLARQQDGRPMINLSKCSLP